MAWNINVVNVPCDHASFKHIQQLRKNKSEFHDREFELPKTSLYPTWTEVWASVPKCHVCQNDERSSRRRRRVSWGSGQTCLQSKITANVKEKPSTVAPHHKRKAQQPNHFDHRHMAGAGCQAACRQSVTDGAVVSPPWCVLLWIWVALGWATGSLNVFILFFFIVLLCRALTL